MRQSIEKRLSNLETRMSELDRIVKEPAQAKDWRRSIGAFTDDPAMQAIFDVAQRIRSAGRARAHRCTGKKPARA